MHKHLHLRIDCADIVVVQAFPHPSKSRSQKEPWNTFLQSFPFKGLTYSLKN